MFPNRYFAPRYFIGRYWPPNAHRSAAPFCFQAVQTFSSGAVEVASFSAGAEKVNAFSGGSDESQAGCP